jgi:hypothetical protein
MHAAAEIFNPETEQVYKYLQVFSACAVSFAHGANDVANAVGPFSGIWYVYRKWAVSSSADTPYWVLALGGGGIVVGLATYGEYVRQVSVCRIRRRTLFTYVREDGDSSGGCAPRENLGRCSVYRCLRTRPAVS